METCRLCLGVGVGVGVAEGESLKGLKWTD
jgi:hypothetical protein